jgi:hypothetical protein
MSLYPTPTEAMPWWHNQPLHLSIEQIDNPLSVCKDFFDTYHLPDIRYCLKEWLEDALRNREAQAIQLLTVYHNTLQLIEAAWLLHQQQLKQTAQQTTL